MRRCRRAVAAVVLCGGLVFGLAAPAGATSAQSWGFVCNASAGWVSPRWPTIYTNGTALTPVYFRARLYQYTTAGWRWLKTTRWYVGVSTMYGRRQLDSSLGVLPYPFVGELGHYFAYYTPYGSFAAGQLGPVFANLPYASYKVREQYWVNGVKWDGPARVQGTTYTSCVA